MAELLVRDLEDELVLRLEQRAAENGRTVEEEHRAILRQALPPTPARGFKELLLAMPGVGDDEDFERGGPDSRLP